jgi:alpha-tubulin suppressor-like RCC1 family protein
LPIWKAEASEASTPASRSDTIKHLTKFETSTPQPVVGLSGVKRVVAGEQHTCALVEDGALYCWGAGDVGQLGTGASEDEPSPTPVAW